MRDYARIVSKIKESVWLITPESLNAILTIMDERIKNGKLTSEEIDARLAGSRDRDEKPNFARSGGIGILPISGPIFGKANLMTEYSGATSLEAFQSDLDEMLQDDTISSIILDIDSPGGTTDLLQETGDMIYSAREIKPVYAIANTAACSAAYWLMSQADAAYATPSGMVGSVGAYTVHEDQSEHDRQEGRRFTIVSAGPFKAEGNEHEPLTQEAEAYRQKIVNQTYSDFIGAIARGRGITTKKVESDFGGGRVMKTKDALEAGVIDGITTFSNLVSHIAQKPRQVSIVSNGKAVAGSLMGNTVTATGISLNSPSYSVSLESRDLEHSEPGTGSPPEPRKDDEEPTDAKEGWRRHTPPDQDTIPSGPSSSAVNGGIKMNEYVFEMRTAQELIRVLELPVDASPTQIVEAVKLKTGELDVLRDSASKEDQEKLFAEQYPAFWSEHNKLMERDRENTARQFADSTKILRRAVGNGLVDTPQALSAAAQTKVVEMHKKFSEGIATVEDFEECVKAITNGGIVTYGEIGSGTNEDEPPQIDTSSAVGVAQSRRVFYEVVTKIMKDDNVDMTTAMNKAAERYPDLAQAYKITLPA